MNIDESEMYSISMDLTWQASQTNVKLFFKFQNHFSNFGIIFQISESFFKLITIF